MHDDRICHFPAVAGIEPKTVPPFAVIAGTGKELPPGETATIAIPDALSTSYSSFHPRADGQGRAAGDQWCQKRAQRGQVGGEIHVHVGQDG